MSSSTSNSSGGIGVTGVLQIVFIVLKLTNVIDWSWWAVLLPTWFAIFVFLLIFVMLFILVEMQR